MSWIILIIQAALAFLKTFFGIASPQTTEVIDAKPAKPLDPNGADDDALLRDLGVRSDAGTASRNTIRDPAPGRADGRPAEQQN